MSLLYANVQGEGAPFVILHGFLGMGDNWKSLGNQFISSGYCVHLVDQRNHGRSFHDSEFHYDAMVNDLKHYCDTLGLSNIVLLGQGPGGTEPGDACADDGNPHCSLLQKCL